MILLTKKVVYEESTPAGTRASRGAPIKDPIPSEWLAEFEAAAYRSLETRLRYALIRTYKPVLDDASYRSFSTMADYRRWCNENLPN